MGIDLVGNKHVAQGGIYDDKFMPGLKELNASKTTIEETRQGFAIIGRVTVGGRISQ